MAKQSSKQATPVDQPVALTVTVFPIKNGKRRVLISGAPDGEMPVVKTGLFGELHGLIDQTWAELLRRKPQVVKKPKTTGASQAGQSDEDEGAGEKPVPAAEATDQLVSGETPATEPPPAEQLPLIEGDTTAPAQEAADTDDEEDEDE